MSRTQVALVGARELERDMKQFADDNYNESFNAMSRCGTKFKKELRSRVRKEVKSDYLLTKGFWTSAPRGAKGSRLYVKFAGEDHSVNPHWHLIEEGHKLITPRYMGYNYIRDIRGIHSVEEFERSGIPGDIVEEEMYKTMEKAMRKNNL